mmetsp:Transcript_2352/g.4971  ORF Transcript_2352/g.4971 Transcript_2352/m.4971 type:complete len:249 (+) Transcript_2352:66-812(+)|eukprot:CAMPEP_0178428234 /NCGR_PEP_ID=MMETSP0689_2-20121128/30170_1 /TAXON_ID=160604 /ORGANISM="Amphidinium massartii, Strain CS-259" /LENGTH=248 /DNA_ID=CAMNT_0020049995 /DNA_START=43 /DNA_END=789 /DNA_ORIENTATION=+
MGVRDEVADGKIPDASHTQVEDLEGRIAYAHAIWSHLSSAATGWWSSSEDKSDSPRVRRRSLPAKCLPRAEVEDDAAEDEEPVHHDKRGATSWRPPVPPSQRSWDFPMSRSEKLLRLQCANEELHALLDMEVKEARAELVKLRRSSTALPRPDIDSDDDEDCTSSAELRAFHRCHAAVGSSGCQPSGREGEDQSFWPSLDDLWLWGGTPTSHPRRLPRQSLESADVKGDIRRLRRQHHFAAPILADLS